MAKGDLIVKVADKETLDKAHANTNAILAAVGGEARVQEIKRYGIKINKNDSNPTTRCTYLFDAVGMQPAAMNYTSGAFDYGDWGDIFFVKNNYPAMVKYDGTEDYKLNPNDYMKKEDGTASDADKMTYGGNAMSVFDGIEGKMWLSQFEIGNYEYMIISNEKYDESYNDDAYVRENGTVANKLYYPMFAGAFDNTRIRSISGQSVSHGANATTEISRVKANGAGWNIGSWSKRNLLNCAMKIMSKTDDTQRAFGQGQTSGYVDNASVNYGHLQTGMLKDKGQFFGYNTTTQQMKAFHIEKWWGGRWDRLNGIIGLRGKIMIKMTPPYNLTAEGYDDTGITPTPTSGGYTNQTKSGRYGRIPLLATGSASTYTCDGFYLNDTIVAIAVVGGACGSGARSGAGCLHLSVAASGANWQIGASVFLE